MSNILYHNLFIHSSTDWYLNLPQFGYCEYCCYVYECTCASLSTCFQWVELWGLMVILCWTLLELPNYFPVAASIFILTSNTWIFQFPYILNSTCPFPSFKKIVIDILLRVSTNSVDLIYMSLRCWAPFHVFVGHLYIFRETSHQDFTNF